MPEFSWPWVAAITAMLVTFLKGLERMWMVARTVERVETNGKTCLDEIREVQERFADFNLTITEEHARLDERVEDAERRLKDIERGRRAR